ncbi:MAG TPA: hypothetical protein VK550_36370 [Polyangiaceae bacterium]|nr:hypothetical protein [Polyangiaceae bacterium]
MSTRDERLLPPVNVPPAGVAAKTSIGPPAARPRQLTIPPPGLEELEAGYAQRPEGAFAPEAAIDEQIASLEAWALANLRSENKEIARFWVLRGIGFLSAVAAAAAGPLQMAHWGIAAGAIAALAIAIDAAWPATADRLARRRAIHDLRDLQHTLKLKWDKVRLAYPDPNTPKRIAHALALLDATQSKREEISKYLGDATPGVAGSLGK